MASRVAWLRWNNLGGNLWRGSVRCISHTRYVGRERKNRESGFHLSIAENSVGSRMGYACSADLHGDELRIMHSAAIVERRRAGPRTITGEDFAPIGQAHISASSAISLATLSRPRRSHFEHATPSIDSLPARSPSMTARLLRPSDSHYR